MDRCSIDPRGLLITASINEFLSDFKLWLTKDDSYKSKNSTHLRMDSSTM